MAARKQRDPWTPEVVRRRIQTSMIVNRLQDHVHGKLGMSRTQIQAAGILLKKVLPDMVATTVDKRPLEDMADSELLATLRSIQGYLAGQGHREGTEDTRELPTAH